MSNFRRRELVGTDDHCICEDCIFYEEQIMINNALVEFYHTKGLIHEKLMKFGITWRKMDINITRSIFLKCMQIEKKCILFATQKLHFTSTSTLKKSSFHTYAQ